jgi:hypothetical protein
MRTQHIRHGLMITLADTRGDQWTCARSWQDTHTRHRVRLCSDQYRTHEGALTATERVYAECKFGSKLIAVMSLIKLSVPNTILRAPRKDDYKSDADTRQRISLYLALIYGCQA